MCISEHYRIDLARIAEHASRKRRKPNMKIISTAMGMLSAAAVLASAGPANAVVYCKYVGVPKGCVAKAGVVLRPAPVAAAVATPGVGAPGVGVRPGTPLNRGGPVNRVGRR
jgi:hypothetical protein